MDALQSLPRVKRTTLRRRKRRKLEPHAETLVLTPSKECVVGFQRVPDLRRALRLARRQRLKIQYVQKDADGKPIHAVVEWKGKPVILTDAYDGTEIH